MFTVGKTRYTKVVHNKYTLCAWQNKLATKHCTEIQQVMYKGRNYYSKLVLKQCYFLLTHHTCLLSRNSTIAHPKPPTSIKRIKRGKWTFQLELCSSGEKKKKSLTSYTRAPSICMTAFNICRESFKSSSLSVWLLDSKCLHFDLWNLTGIQFIKACIKNKGLLFLKIIHRGHQAGGSTIVLGQESLV